MKVDTTQWQRNRYNFSRLYQSLKNAYISHSDMVIMCGNPYITTMQNWQNISYSRQQIIRREYPEMPHIATTFNGWLKEQKQFCDWASERNGQCDDAFPDVIAAYTFVRTAVTSGVSGLSTYAKNLFKTRQVVKTIEKNAQKIDNLTSNQKGKIAEKYVGNLLGKDGRPQVSYSWKKEVKYGTGSGTRVDFVYKNKVAIEVKNWDIAKNTNGLVSNIVDQVKKRVLHLPDGMKQEIWLYIKDKKVTREMFKKVQDKIVEKCNGVLKHQDIKPVGGTPE